MKIIFISILFFAFNIVTAQVAYQSDSISNSKPATNTVQKKPFKDKLYTGGNIGLSGNFSDYLSIRVSPLLGAKLTPKFYAGLGIEYIYTMDDRYDMNVNAHDYGARLFGQYDLIKKIFAHAELAGYNYDSYYTISSSDRIFVPYIWLGGGYRTMISKRSFFSVRVLFDVLQDDNSPYKSGEPQISVGFGVGL